jgi:CRISPR-associated protein Cas1
MAEIRNLHELPKFKDGLSYIYVEHAVIEREALAICVFKEEGAFMVPTAALGVLFLGPGTRITHAAVNALAESGTSIVWMGEEGARFYASGTGETRGARRLYRQVRAWVDPKLHLEVVYRLYKFRFPEPLPDGLALEQLRGKEGVRVREAYAQASRRTGVPWHGRRYRRDRWEDSDPVNRALSAGAAFLYGICHAAIVSAGYSPALGFIHTGKQLSFVYDVADLYKADTLIPLAFDLVMEYEESIERRMRHGLRERIREVGLLKRIVDDLNRLFLGLDEEKKDISEVEDRYAEDPSRPGGLWDPSGERPGGISYGGDDFGEGSQEP